MYDMAGNEMTRADQEQSKLMASMQRLVDLATPAYSISHPNPSAEAARALQVAGGLKAVGTIPDVQKDMATARHMNVTSDLAPGMANATNAAHYASANASNANANKAGLESQYYPKIANSEIGIKNAQAYALRNPNSSHNYDLEMREKAAGIASKLSELSPENFQSNYDNVMKTIYGEPKKKKVMTVKDAMSMLPK